MGNLQDQSQVSPEDFSEMPSPEELRQYNSEDQKRIISHFQEKQNAEEGSTEESKNTETKSSSKEQSGEETTGDEKNQTKQTEEGASESSNSEDKQTKEEKTKEHRELEAEFTRRSQKLKKTEEQFSQIQQENQQLKERLSKLEGMVQGKQTDKNTEKTEDTMKSVTEPLDKMAEANPKIKPLVDSVKQSLEASMKAKDRELEELKGAVQEFRQSKQQTAQKEQEQNLETLRTKIDEFLNGPLKELEPQFNEVIGERFSNSEEMEAEAAKNPRLFDELEEKLKSRFYRKVAELESKAEADDPKKRNKEVNSTGVGKKPKTGQPKGDDLDMDVFRKKSSDEQRKILARQGVVED